MNGDESTEASSDEWTLPAATEIGRVALRVNDLDRLTAFYRDVVGLSVQTRTTDTATLGAGDRPLLELIGDPDAAERDPSETGLFHTAFLVPSRQALADALARVERQTELSGAADHLVSEALYLDDPEGNGIELYRDRPRSEWPMRDDGVDLDTLPLDLVGLRHQSESADSVPDGTTIGHVHLEVSSIERSREFYIDRLGFEVMQTYGPSALFVAAGGYHHHLGLNVWNDRTDPGTGRGLDWFELRLPSESAVKILRERLHSGSIDTESTATGFVVSAPDEMSVRLSRSRQ